MKLDKIIKSIQYLQLLQPKEEREIRAIKIDSRHVEHGDMFIAINGTQVDGHKYIGSAIEKGASAIMCETLPENTDSNVAYIRVQNCELTAGNVAKNFFDNPTEKLKLVGVTGTNGKTTIATLLYQLFTQMGHKCGLISTVCNYINDKAIPTSHTTPDSVTLNALFAEMADSGCEYAFMEVSSHALAQHRVEGITFAGAIFTNLTRDHIDYHLTFDNYLKCKKRLFDMLSRDAFALINIDDKNGPVMVQNCRGEIKRYSTRTICDYKGRMIEEHFNGMLLEFNKTEFTTHLIGRFNVSNLLAIFGAAIELGKEKEEILREMSTLLPVSGRFETIHSKEGYTAIVDYAHTPDALKNVLATLNEIQNNKGNIICVVGAGGNRDKGKRPLMAQEAAKASTQLIITSDNPRFEEPQDIINDMLWGLSEQQATKTLNIVDRKEAIRTACELAKKGDVILIAGKGHENYQDIKGVKYHFDDKEIINEIFKN